MTAANNVSQPPLMAPVIDQQGRLSKAWAIFFRDIYNRVAYKGGNAIDDNKAEVDQELLGINSTLQQTIDQVNVNIQDIATNESDITTNAQGIAQNALSIAQNAQDLADHEALEEAHGSNGVIVGFGDLADEVTVGLVKRMALISDAVDTLVNITTTDIGAAPAAYNQAYTQSVTDLTNENKAAINQLASDLNDAIAVLNNLLANSKTSGQMSTT